VGTIPTKVWSSLRHAPRISLPNPNRPLTPTGTRSRWPSHGISSTVHGSGCPSAFSSRIAAFARRPSGRFADFSEIGVHTCLCPKLVGRRGWVANLKVESRRQLDTMEVAGWVLKIIRDDKPRRGRRTAPHSARGRGVARAVARRRDMPRITRAAYMGREGFATSPPQPNALFWSGKLVFDCADCHLRI
jgi:hypothetical protein